jgi:hypothetical protein
VAARAARTSAVAACVDARARQISVVANATSCTRIAHKIKNYFDGQTVQMQTITNQTAQGSLNAESGAIISNHKQVMQSLSLPRSLVFVVVNIVPQDRDGTDVQMQKR